MVVARAAGRTRFAVGAARVGPAERAGHEEQCETPGDEVDDADDEDASYAIAAILALGAVSLFVFPVIGRAFGMTDHAYGLWVGLAVDNTAEATAAGALYSQTGPSTRAVSAPCGHSCTPPADWLMAWAAPALSVP